MALNIGEEEDNIFQNSSRTSEGFTSSKPREREMFMHSVSPSPNTFQGNTWPVTEIGVSGECFFIVKLPDDFQALTEAAIMIWPDATENIQWDIFTSVASVGEPENSFENNDLNVQKAVTAEIITEINLLLPTVAAPEGLWGNAVLKAGDYISILFQSDTDVIGIVGLRLKYL